MLMLMRELVGLPASQMHNSVFYLNTQRIRPNGHGVRCSGHTCRRYCTKSHSKLAEQNINTTANVNKSISPNVRPMLRKCLCLVLMGQLSRRVMLKRSRPAENGAERADTWTQWKQATAWQFSRGELHGTAYLKKRTTHANPFIKLSCVVQSNQALNIQSCAKICIQMPRPLRSLLLCCCEETPPSNFFTYGISFTFDVGIFILRAFMSSRLR